MVTVISTKTQQDHTRWLDPGSRIMQYALATEAQWHDFMLWRVLTVESSKIIVLWGVMLWSFVDGFRFRGACSRRLQGRNSKIKASGCFEMLVSFCKPHSKPYRLAVGSRGFSCLQNKIWSYSAFDSPNNTCKLFLITKYFCITKLISFLLSLISVTEERLWGCDWVAELSSLWITGPLECPFNIAHWAHSRQLRSDITFKLARFCSKGNCLISLIYVVAESVSENRVLRGSNRGMGKMEELRNLYSYRIIRSRRMGWVGHVIHAEILVRKSEWKRSLGRQRHWWQVNIDRDLKEMGIEGVNCILLAKDKDQCWILVNPVINHWVPWKAGNILHVREIGSLWGRTLVHVPRWCAPKRVRLNQTEKWIDMFCFSGSGGRPDHTGGCPVLVGAVFQKTSKPQPFEKSSELTPWCAAQWTIPLLTGE